MTTVADIERRRVMFGGMTAALARAGAPLGAPAARMARLVRSMPAALLFLSACSAGGEADRNWVLAEGDWGWGAGEGCAGLADVIRIEDDALRVFIEGEVAAQGKIVKRSVIYRDGSTGTGGKVDGMRWTYVSREEGRQLAAYEERFSLRRRGGKPVSLLAALKRTRIDLDTNKRERVPNPRKGDGLSPCLSGAASDQN